MMNKIIRTFKKYGIIGMILTLMSKMLYRLYLVIYKFHLVCYRRQLKLINKRANIKEVKGFLNETQKVAILTSAFEFNEYANQRPINFAKYLVENGYKVLFVVWQFDSYTKIKNANKEVYKNILQLSLYDFINYTSVLDVNDIKEKMYYISFPAELHYNMVNTLRKQGVYVYYDIMDEWEEFNKVGQACWYKKEIEEQLILEADLVSAVSPSLVDKFNFLREDILLSPNGFFEKTIGENSKNIAKKVVEDTVINIGYFGHLTASWFDWDLIFDVAKKNKNIVFHIIGYGEDDYIREKFEKYPNIKFYGKISTNLLYKYVKEWNLAIIPFKKSKLAEAVDPIKIYEYIYMGLKTIATGITNLKNYPNTYVAYNEEDFVKKIYECVDEKEYEDIDKFLGNSTWDNRFNNIIEQYKNKTLRCLYDK